MFIIHSRIPAHTGTFVILHNSLEEFAHASGIPMTHFDTQPWTIEHTNGSTPYQHIGLPIANNKHTEYYADIATIEPFVGPECTIVPTVPTPTSTVTPTATIAPNTTDVAPVDAIPLNTTEIDEISPIESSHFSNMPIPDDMAAIKSELPSAEGIYIFDYQDVNDFFKQSGIAPETLNGIIWEVEEPGGKKTICAHEYVIAHHPRRNEIDAVYSDIYDLVNHEIFGLHGQTIRQAAGF